MVPASYLPHPLPQTYTGVLNFSSGFAYLVNETGGWALLQYDPHLDAVASLDTARQTAIQLRYGRIDGDPLAVDGILLPSVFDPSSFILFWDKQL